MLGSYGDLTTFNIFNIAGRLLRSHSVPISAARRSWSNIEESLGKNRKWGDLKCD